MVVKFKIDSESDIPAALKDEYEARDGAFYLKVEGTDDAKAIKAALDKERADHKKAKDALSAIDAERETARLEALKAKGDIAALETSWAEKNAREKKELQDKLDARDKAVKATAKQAAASALAARISTAPPLMERYIVDRLSVELDGDTPIIRVRAVDGRPSAASLTDLEQELLADKNFAAIIKVSNASGGGAGSAGGAGGKDNGGAGPKRILEMSTLEKKAHLDRVGREAFQAQAAKEQAAL